MNFDASTSAAAIVKAPLLPATAGKALAKIVKVKMVKIGSVFLTAVVMSDWKNMRPLLINLVLELPRSVRNS